tara:strand:- start:393 stop:587 length:195 start_codon:yes stop_codon:yes gene_type:complete
MKKFEYQRSVRFSEPVKESLQEVCDAFRVNESDYIRTSVQRCLLDDMQKQGLEPKFYPVGVLNV